MSVPILRESLTFYNPVGPPTSALQDLPHKSPKVSENEIGATETLDLEKENIHTIEQREKEKNFSFFDFTKKKNGMEEDRIVSESPLEVQASRVTSQEGACKPAQKGDKSIELFIRAAEKGKETSSNDTPKTEATDCRDLLLKKSASSTAEKGNVKQGLREEKLVNQAHEPAERAAGGGGQENDSRKIDICK